jgi:CheY-like chemotaxis protein
VPLDTIIEGAVEAAHARLDAQGQHLSVDLPQTPAAIMGDAARLGQIFSNLLGNASKFTPQGGHIAVQATVDDAWIEVVVSDDGSGMAPDLLPHIFELFTQGPRALARSEGGLGIGLNVVRNLVELHGGTVQAASPGENLGSTFTVRLPRASGEPDASSESSAKKQHAPLNILLLEDNHDARAALEALLAADGHAVAVGASGTAGLRQLHDEPCDLLVCDVGLPGMDGIALIQQVRATLPDSVGVAIAISGYGDAATRNRALAAGFDGYLVKPVDMQALMNLFDTLSVNRQGTVRPGPTPPP